MALLGSNDWIYLMIIYVVSEIKLCAKKGRRALSIPIEGGNSLGVMY